MKKTMKWLLAALLLCVGSTGVQAQEDYESYKMEVGVSYGAAAMSTFARIGQAIGDAMVAGLGGAKHEDTSWFGSLSAEFYYNLEPEIGIGLIGCFSQDNDDKIRSGQILGDRTTRFITVMPSFKWNYLRHKHFGMYMKFAAGYTFEHTSETVYAEHTGGQGEVTGSDNDGFFNLQISPLGLEAGAKNVRAFFELGFGEQGIALAGLRYKF